MELIVILVLALVVLGPQRIPEVASSLGKAIRGFRKATRELREHIDIEDEVRRPFEDLRAALRDEPSRYKPAASLVTVSGDPNFPKTPLDPDYVPPSQDPEFGVTAPATMGEATAVDGAHDPGHLASAGGTPSGSASAGAAAPTASEPAVSGSVGASSLISPPDEPVVSANTAADHFQRAAQAAAPAKGAS